MRILTGTRPTGAPHIGNYFGAFLPALELANQDQGRDLYFIVADLNSLNTPSSPQVRRQNLLEMLAALFAVGIDPKTTHFFLQSLIPEISEMMWFLSCHTPFSFLLRSHSFKDHQAQNKELNAGLFNYPLLMGADILLFNPDKVPVGKDQKQHLEMVRDIAIRCNNQYGELFKIPDPMISETTGTLPGLDGEKMSKSKNNTIPLFATDKEWKKAVMAIATDSRSLEDVKDPDQCTIFRLFSLIETKPARIEEIRSCYLKGGYGYGHAKLELVESLKSRFSEMRDRYFSFLSQPHHLYEAVIESSKRVRFGASETMLRVKDHAGLLSRS